MKKSKSMILIVTVLVLVISAVAAVLIFKPWTSSSPVDVFRIGDGIIGLSDYFEPAPESYGIVTTDHVQPIYLSETQKVLQVFVKEGQRVKKGDKLFTYDTTLTDLQLQRKDLAIQQLKINLKTAENELKKIRGYRPIYYKPTKPTEPPVKPIDKDHLNLDVTGRNYVIYAGTGNTSFSPKYCWIRSGTPITDEVIEDLFASKDEWSDRISVVFQNTENDSGTGKISTQYGVTFIRQEESLQPGVPTLPIDPTEPTAPESAETEPSEPAVPNTSESVQKPNPQSGETVYRYSMILFNPADRDEVFPDTPPQGDDVEWNSGFTASEIATMKAEKEKEIKELSFNIRLAEAEYKIMKKEADDGTLRADFDGVVTEIHDQDDSASENQLFMKVSGGGGFSIQGTVSELYLDTIEVGQEINIISWDTGVSCMGHITEIGQYPVESNGQDFSGSGSSVYPYTVFVDENESLQDGFYVNMQMESGTPQDSGLYVSKAFIRIENGQSYVYAKNSDGLLEKREVVTGRTLWDSYILIKEGLTQEDCLAFPYGKNLKDGIPTQNGDWESFAGA